MSKVMIIVNPTSGNESAPELMGQLTQILSAQFQAIDIRVTGGAGDAKKFAELACEGKYDRLYVLGGDGTVSEVVNGVGAHVHRPQIGIVPLGTVNNLARMLEIPTNMNQYMQQVADMEPKNIDIGKLNAEYFASTVSAGSIPASVQDVDPNVKTKLGPLAYLLEGLKALNTEDRIQFKFELDEETFQSDAELIVVGLGNSVTGIGTFFSDASLTDGYLHLFLLENVGAMEKLSLIPEVFRAEKTLPAELESHIRSVNFTKGTISIVKGENQEVTVDGDTGPEFPLKLELLPAYMSFLAPKGQDGNDLV